MRVLIFGGTGRTGAAAAASLLQRGAEVAVYCRPTSILPSELSGRVTRHAGSCSDESAIQAALSGVDAVVISVGNSKLVRGETVRGDVTRSVAAAVAATRRDDLRVVVVSVLGARGSGDQVPWYARALVKVVLARPIADHNEQEAVLCEMLPPAQRLIVRPVGLNDGPFTGKYRTSTRGVVRSWRVSRRDVGDFVAGQIFAQRAAGGGETEDYFGHCVAITE